jgi:anhydro-N-acetylmuramic acid kinase
VLWIGLIPGTSADGVDAALVRIGDAAAHIELIALRTEPIDDGLRSRIHECVQGSVRLHDLVRLHRELGERFAEAARRVAADAGIRVSEVQGIGSHGQTVAHFPDAKVGGSLQLGSPAVIHERTGIPVVADFRSGDIAAGGQGAPLTPFFHHAYFARNDETRAVLNIGGFTNVTFLPSRDLEDVVAFDPGPGNALLDRATRWGTQGQEHFDRGGARALRGSVLGDLLDELLGDPYFALPPPKSTGHERFGAAFFERAREGVSSRGGGVDDLLATLAALTVESVVRSAKTFFPKPVERWILCGGGAHNPALVEPFRARVAPVAVDLSEDHGVPGDALEAVTFGVLGWASSRGMASNVLRATGARRPVVLGSAIPPNAFPHLAAQR